jgi:predicted transcriptional regulator
LSLRSYEEEELVYSAVQNYLNENKILDKSNVISYINSYFAKASINISVKGIIKHLESLVEKKRIVEGSKLTKVKVLRNSSRKKIHDFIIENPGVYYNKIVKDLKLSNHVVYWHTSILLKFGLIKTTKIENHDIFFNYKLKQDEVKKYYFSAIKEKSRKMLKFLKNYELGITGLKLASILQIHPKTVKKYLIYLEEVGLVEKKKVSAKKTLYFYKDY